MQYINLFPTPLFIDDQLVLAKEILPVAEDYINQHGIKYLGQDKYDSTYSVNSAGLLQQNDFRLNKLNNSFFWISNIELTCLLGIIKECPSLMGKPSRIAKANSFSK